MGAGTAQEPTLGELADAAAVRSGAWVLVERDGELLAHGRGRTACPDTVARTVVTQSTAPLRQSTLWRRHRGHRVVAGSVDQLPVEDHDLGEGLAAWFIDGPTDVVSLSMLAQAAASEPQVPTDPVVKRLIRPSSGLRGAGARRRGGCARRPAKRHGPRPVVDQVRRRCLSAVAGVATVPVTADDWFDTARPALDGADAASDLGLALALADPANPEVAAELVVRAADTAVAAFLRRLPAHPPMVRVGDFPRKGNAQGRVPAQFLTVLADTAIFGQLRNRLRGPCGARCLAPADQRSGEPMYVETLRGN